MSGKELVWACTQQEWEKARALIEKNPEVLPVALNEYNRGPAYWVSYHGNVEMLQFMYETITKLPGQQEQMLKRFFETPDDRGDFPSTAAACGGQTRSLEFLARYAPSGTAILEVKNERGETPAHWAALNGHVNALEFILENAPRGMMLLRDKCLVGDSPMDSLKIREHFTSEKIREIGIKRELDFLRSQEVSNSGSLAALVFNLLVQNTELI